MAYPADCHQSAKGEATPPQPYGLARGASGHLASLDGGVPKLSIIMPVYNSAQFMGRGIEKVLSQSVEELELICVDDCSSDDSAAIINSYMAKDARVRGVFRTENGGSASARNSGLEAARGEYIAFLDSDDYPADAFFYEKLLEKARAHDADIVKGSYQRENSPTKVDPQNALIKANKHNFIYNFWSAIFRKALLDKHGIRFPPIRGAEDPPFALHAAIHANMVATCDEAVLTVVLRPGSKTRTAPHIARALDLFTSLGIIVDLMNGHENFPKMCYIRNFVFLTMEILIYWKSPDSSVPEEIITENLNRIRQGLSHERTIWAILEKFPLFPDILRKTGHAK